MKFDGEDDPSTPSLSYMCWRDSATLVAVTSVPVENIRPSLMWNCQFVCSSSTV